MGRPQRRTGAILGVLALGAALVSTPSWGAPAAPVLTGPTVVGEAPDYATEVRADPWDYTQPTDILLDGPGPTQGVTGQAVTGGRLRFDVAGDGFVSPLWVSFTDALPAHGSGPTMPIDAGRYTHVAMRAFSTLPVPAAFTWFRCRRFANDCLGGHRFTLQAGWNTYVLALENEFPGLPQPWAGEVIGLRLAASSAVPDHVEVDWLRVFRPTAPSPVTWTSVGPGALYWDADADPGNNTPDQPGWGLVATSADSGTHTTPFPSDAYPPGTYRFASLDATGASPYSAPLTVDAAPVPRVLDPDVTGGEDYATAVLGDPWNMNAPSDAAALGNVTSVVWDGQRLHATNAPPQQNDPFVRLRLGADGFDADRYHRLTVKMSYDGPFGLDNAPGGGTHGRLLWWRADSPGNFHNSREIVTWTDRDTYVVDLGGGDAQEAGDRDVREWNGALSMLRWDPNEDPGARRWHLDGVWLRADDEATGHFDIRWVDDRWRAGSVATVRVDRDRDPSDGVLVAPATPQQAGVNVVRWDVRDALPGRHWVGVEVSNGITTTSATSTGPVVVPPRLAGPDRIATAIALSRSAHPDGAPTVVVARAGDFPDALAAAPLADAAGAPVLLNGRDALDGRVREEIARLGAGTVLLMGGPAAQSPAVEQALAAVPGLAVERVAGSDRYGTAAAAAERATALWAAAGVPGAGSGVLVALGTRFPDALAAGPLAARTHRPILLVTPGAVPDATRASLLRLGARDATVVGGSQAIGPGAVAALQAAGVEVARIGGANRYHTAQLLAAAAAAAGADPGTVLVARGGAFPDALAAGPAVSARNGVLLLTARTALPAETRQHLTANAVRWLRVAGGAAAVDAATVRAVLDAAGIG